MHAGKTGDRAKDGASNFPDRNWGDWGKNGREYDIDGYICSQHETLKEKVVSKTKKWILKKLIKFSRKS